MQRLAEEMPRLWKETKWENTHKAAYWRLTVNGIPLLGNSHMRRAGVARCGCGVRLGQGESWGIYTTKATPLGVPRRPGVGQVEHAQAGGRDH
jgi:hypothetical protein